MDDKDHVFARFKDDKPVGSIDVRLLTIPRRAGATGSRAVEVVHVRSGGAAKAAPQRVDPRVRAASWEAGFPAKQAVAAYTFVEPAIPEAAVPIAHVMPAWESAVTAVTAAPRGEAPVSVAPRGQGRPRAHPPQEPATAEMAAGAVVERVAASRRGPGRPHKAIANAPARHVADPFDASDDGANCMLCGYVIEPPREKRGLMTCAGCG